MQNLQYPLFFEFKITTFSSDFNITDKNGKSLAYVRQKLFKLKEDVQVFNNESKSREMFRIRANQWLDFNASYSVTDAQNQNLGRIARRGMRSFWKATYTIIDGENKDQYTVQEENAWVKILDGLFSEVPILGMFTGYFFNPSYVVQNTNGKNVFQLKKMPSFWGRKFMLQKIGDFDPKDEQLIILSLMMMVLLERSRG